MEEAMGVIFRKHHQQPEVSDPTPPPYFTHPILEGIRFTQDHVILKDGRIFDRGSSVEIERCMLKDDIQVIVKHIVSRCPTTKEQEHRLALGQSIRVTSAYLGTRKNVDYVNITPRTHIWSYIYDYTDIKSNSVHCDRQHWIVEEILSPVGV